MRIDQSSWLIHFVHRRDPENDPKNRCEGFVQVPVAYTEDGVPIVSDWDYLDEEYPIAPDDYPIAVLKKIVDDAHIRTTWADRRGKPTIYGPRSAVCFTEMPLYALVDYAQMRRREEAVATYGIALPKNELFIAGARPVIYGLTSKHAESATGDPFYRRGCRMLSAACGIAPNEQYRYVAMNLADDRHIDWSHEREWRWTKNFGESHNIPGLSLWLADERYRFSTILLIVQTKDEAADLLNRLKGYYDNPYTKYDMAISREAVASTRVLALDSVADNFVANPTLRIDDLPASTFKTFERKEPSEETMRLVKQVVEAARETAVRVAVENPANSLYGFAWVTTYDAQTEITEALLRQGFAKSYDTRGYRVEEVMRGVQDGFMIDTAEKAAEAAATMLTTELGQKFYMESRLD